MTEEGAEAIPRVVEAERSFRWSMRQAEEGAPQLPCRCSQGAQAALDSLPQIWPPSAAGASAAALGQVKICGAGVSIKASAPAPQAPPRMAHPVSGVCCSPRLFKRILCQKR